MLKIECYFCGLNVDTDIDFYKYNGCFVCQICKEKLEKLFGVNKVEEKRK